MRKLLSVTIVAMLLLLNITPVFAENASNVEVSSIGNVDKKIALVERANSKRTLLSSEKSISEEEKLEIIKSISSGEKEYTEAQLNNLGIYTLESNNSNKIMISPGQSDVSLGNVSCYYFDTEDEWVLNGVGQWNNDNWRGNKATIPGVYHRDIGGLDTLGITLYETNTAPYYLDLKSSSHAWIEDKLGVESSINVRNPSNLNTKSGVIYQFQDVFSYEKQWPVGYKNFNYLGYKFGVIAVYNGSFKNYTGKAKLFYGHTWDTGVISGISVGVDSGSVTAGLDYDVVGKSFMMQSSSACDF